MDLIKNTNLDLDNKLNICIDEKAKEAVNAIMIGSDHLIVVDDETCSKDAFVSLTGSFDGFFSISHPRPSLYDICSFDVYDDFHQEPFAGKKGDLGKFSIKHNRENLQKDARYINKQNRIRRFSGKI